MKAFDLERAQKFSSRYNYFDINYVWAYPYRYVTEWLYHTPVRPEQVVFASLACGVISAYFYLNAGDAKSLILAVLFIQLKNILDTVDGSLARAKGLDSKIGRFLDSLSDAVVYLLVFSAISFNLFQAGGGFNVILLSALALLSLFIQCSYFHFYQVAYLNQISTDGTSRIDEAQTDEDNELYDNRFRQSTLNLLQRVYSLIYGWQDRIILWIDGRILSSILRATSDQDLDETRLLESWYSHKGFLTADAFLCFGTQILILSIFTLTNRLEAFFWFMIVAGNLYLVTLIFARYAIFSRKIVR